MLKQPWDGFGFGSNLRPAPPMSNVERQQRFQLAHPGYDRQRKARERAGAKRGAELMLRQLGPALQAEVAQANQALPAEAPTEATVVKPVLMLPAPVVDPMMAELEAMKASLTRRREAEGVPRAEPASDASRASRAA